MAFYIKPPDGFGTLERLRVFTLRRMNFLLEVQNCAEAPDFQQLLEKGTTAVDSDCLIEGSKKDRISHFLLRLICSLDAELSSFLVKAETELFCHRFSCMNSEELIQFLKATHRFLCRLQRHQKLQEAENSASTLHGSCARPVLSSITRSQEAYSLAVNNLLQVLNLILEAAGSWKLAVKLYMDYSSIVFAVPFQHALCLVASRQVTLDRGMAFVPFSSLHIVLAAMFEDILREGIGVARHVQHHFLEDARMRSISREVHAAFHRAQAGYRSKTLPLPGNGNVIQEYQIDHLHYFFPPCMSHLHRTLRRKHRLRHFSRIQYTLFLKSIGLPVEDAIHFWKSEYSKPSHCHDNGSGGCQHSWAKDERRYTYNIRHLYGLEGSRINYRAHSCKVIQPRPIRHVRRRTYSTDNDEEAQRLVATGMPIRQAAEHCGMPESTLRSHIKGKHLRGRTRRTFFTSDDEKALADHLTYMAECVYGLSRGQMMQLGYGEEGGCPFKHFDDSSLQGLMDIEEIVGPQKEDITSERQKGKYNMACRKYLHAKQTQINRHCDSRAVHQLEKNLKEASYLREGSCQSGMRHQPEVLGSTPEGGSVNDKGLELSMENSHVPNPMDMLQKSHNTSMERDDVISSAIRTNDLQHTGYENEKREGSSPNHIDSYQPSVSVHCGFVCNSPTMSCHIADREMDTVESSTDAAHKYDSGDVSLLLRKSSAATGMCKGCDCGCSKPLPMAKSSMCKNDIGVSALKRECAIATGGGSQKVAKMTTASVESHMNSERARTYYEGNVKEKTIIHEGSTVIAPSFDRDLVQSPSNEKLRAEVSSKKANLEESFSDCAPEVEDLSILRPSDFYYSFRKMVHDLDQDKAIE